MKREKKNFGFDLVAESRFGPGVVHLWWMGVGEDQERSRTERFSPCGFPPCLKALGHRGLSSNAPFGEKWWGAHRFPKTTKLFSLSAEFSLKKSEA